MFTNAHKSFFLDPKNEDSQLHVADVYDLAADIGREFEKMIDLCGPEQVRNLMTNVIITLEYLESSTVSIENLQVELLEIKSRVKQLEYEKLEKAESRSKLDHDLEQIEENWRIEIAQLNILISKLQEENKRMSKSLADKEATSPDLCKAFLSDENLHELQMLKDVTDNQRGQLLNKDKELIDACSSLEMVQMKAEDFSKHNKELALKNRYLQRQMFTLVEEKSDLQVRLQEQQHELQILQKKYSEAVKENMDLSTAEDKNALDLSGKLIIDVDDPNRPRFTVDELRHILFERNDLKAKVSDLEDELSLHRPKTVPKSPSTVSISPVPTDYDIDLPVQGPINREPDEKLYPDKKLHGIRRFFGFLWRKSMDSPITIVSASPPSTGQSSVRKKETTTII